MNKNGVTLIELMVGIGIVTIMLAIAGFQFAGWQRKYNQELEIKELYADLQKARARAKGMNRMYFFRLDTGAANGGWETYEDSNNSGPPVDTAGDAKQPDLTKPRTRPDGTLEPPSKYRYRYNNGAVLDVQMDKRGLLAIPAAPPPYIISVYDPAEGTLDPHERTDDAEYNCIVLTASRINLGKLNADGVTCDAK